jgi:hypothetical protein
MEENKKLFVEKLGSLIKRQTRAGQTINDLRYESTLIGERVVIVFNGGFTKAINITGNSCIAIMAVITKALM